MRLVLADKEILGEGEQTAWVVEFSLEAVDVGHGV
jgi:hypothetical protein